MTPSQSRALKLFQLCCSPKGYWWMGDSVMHDDADGVSLYSRAIELEALGKVRLVRDIVHMKD